MVAARLFEPEKGRQRVDRYELIGEIASGGMATVYLARLSGVGGFRRFVAMKRLHPHLAKEGGIWRLHHHPGDAPLVPMWTAVCAEGMARMIGAGHADRFGTCAASDCERVFFDTSRNASRRYCSTTCQNREKTAAFRRRARAGRRRPRAGAFSRDGA